ncbi:DUF3052 family protein [Streptomyces sp. A1547]|nr:DUF3052 family protein [Streptomyces sp. A1547]
MPSDITRAAQSSGLCETKNENVGDWLGVRLVAP